MLQSWEMAGQAGAERGSPQKEGSDRAAPELPQPPPAWPKGSFPRLELTGGTRTSAACRKLHDGLRSHRPPPPH